MCQGASDAPAFFFQAGDGIRGRNVTGVQTCALPICITGVGEGGTLEGTELAGGGSQDHQIGRASCRERVEKKGDAELLERSDGAGYDVADKCSRGRS